MLRPVHNKQQLFGSDNATPAIKRRNKGTVCLCDVCRFIPTVVDSHVIRYLSGRLSFHFPHLDLDGTNTTHRQGAAMDNIANSCATCAACGAAAQRNCKGCYLVLVSLPVLTMRFFTNDGHSTVGPSAKRLIGLSTKYIANLTLGSLNGNHSGFPRIVNQLSMLTTPPRKPPPLRVSSYGAMCRLMMSCNYLRTKGRATTKIFTFCLPVSPRNLLAQIYRVKQYAKTDDIASGDLRNIVKTITCLPTGFIQRTEVYINDRDLDVVARNLILLLIGLTVEDDNEAVECMIHVWYSAFLRASDMAILRDRILPMIDEVCREIQNNPPALILGKTWTFAQHSCRIELTKESWEIVMLHVDHIRNLSAERASQIRSAAILAPNRLDDVEKHMLALTPTQRICKQRFREDGLLLPFGASRLDSNVPNP